MWIYGLRNPFRFHIEPATGEIAIGDVGWDTWEELDIAAQGRPRLRLAVVRGPVAVADHLRQLRPVLGPAVRLPAAVERAVGVGDQRRLLPRRGERQRALPARVRGQPVLHRLLPRLGVAHEAIGRLLGVRPPVAGQGNPNYWATGNGTNSDFLVAPDGSLWYCQMHLGATSSRTPGRSAASAARSTSASSRTRPRAGSRSRRPYPSPTSGAVTIAYTLPRDATVTLEIFDPLGRRVRTLALGVHARRPPRVAFRRRRRAWRPGRARRLHRAARGRRSVRRAKVRGPEIGCRGSPLRRDQSRRTILVSALDGPDAARARSRGPRSRRDRTRRGRPSSATSVPPAPIRDGVFAPAGRRDRPPRPRRVPPPEPRARAARSRARGSASVAGTRDPEAPRARRFHRRRGEIEGDHVVDRGLDQRGGAAVIGDEAHAHPARRRDVVAHPEEARLPAIVLAAKRVDRGQVAPASLLTRVTSQSLPSPSVWNQRHQPIAGSAIAATSRVGRRQRRGAAIDVAVPRHVGRGARSR